MPELHCPQASPSLLSRSPAPPRSRSSTSAPPVQLARQLTPVLDTSAAHRRKTPWAAVASFQSLPSDRCPQRVPRLAFRAAPSVSKHGKLPAESVAPHPQRNTFVPYARGWQPPSKRSSAALRL